MSRIVLTAAVEGAVVDPIGAKEAVLMALEPLGGVRLLSIEVQEPEQIHMASNWSARKE